MVKANGTGESVTFTSVNPDEAPQPNRGSLQIALSHLNPELVERAGISTGSTTLVDNAIVSFNKNSRLEKFVFNTDLAKLYIPQGTEEYAIVDAEVQGEMPLNFKAKENGSYTISVNPEGVEMTYLHLIDNMTGADVDLLAATSTGSVASYTFTAKTTDYESRFKLVFAVNDGPSTGSGTFAFISNGNLIVNGTGTLQIIDILGRELVRKELSTANCQLSTPNCPGVYVLRLINGDDVKTQKIVVR